MMFLQQFILGIVMLVIGVVTVFTSFKVGTTEGLAAGLREELRNVPWRRKTSESEYERGHASQWCSG